MSTNQNMKSITIVPLYKGPLFIRADERSDCHVQTAATRYGKGKTALH